MKNFFEISVLKEGEELPKDCIVENVGGANGVKIMHGISEDDIPTTAAFLFDKRKWSMDGAEDWIKETVAKPEPVKKSFTCEFKSFNDEELSFEATASKTEVDRDGDILRASGWVLKNFKNNPVMLWGHNSSMLPVGRAENVRKEDDKLLFKAVFTPKDINPLGDQIYKMYKAKFLNAFSVRFDAFEWKDREAPKEGVKPEERFGKEYTKMDLLEISPVTVPALASALINRDFKNFVVKSMQMQNIDLVTDPLLRDKILKDKIEDVTEPEVIEDKEKKKESTIIKRIKETVGDYSYEEVIEVLKSGRVLSAKNRTLVNTAIEAIGKTSGALQALLEAAEPQAGFGSDEELSKLKEDLNKIGEEEGVERIIQDGNKLLNEIEGGK